MLFTKSVKPDGIHPRILKELADVITKPLLMIFEHSWESWEVPADWKLTNLGPIFKKGKKEDPGNSSTCKVMEGIILEGIEKQLKDNRVTGHSQNGFMRGNSLSNLISFYDNVTHLGDQGKPLDVIILDFVQLSTQSLTGSFWTKCPAQRHHAMSEQFAHRSSTEDEGLEGILSKFTDDTKLGGAVDSLKDREALQGDLSKSEDWAITNHMKFNESNCQILHLKWGNSDVHTDWGMRGYRAALWKGI
ncbi:hypothetical protein WISP_22348 [Willisornis vidua]|uniref:Rna-directed dna polymerase from mobile element jockey-like n=1 Tax=Willisornis vidua TaxID=1566151 RepID=A0ABQ9DNL9_9PASS|nr:hypothetical protein WISP_22348 [Willisornis vidua]